ncbi:(2Fe-2S)-binding protein [Streptomyces sp. ISL-86]|uniref:(2Fe-2S)-binding protein n=1 Tax=Streptomyces sp. ISL-86 TaxID=2819187 RepID=UPI001BECB69C|nr:(2Fe-2S)-binding protein [Streptomyces sp. ISL-86]MBT2457573.1 (2Fe-2S)-binding protein [Streptomyces sp. ISL-86]
MTTPLDTTAAPASVNGGRPLASTYLRLTASCEVLNVRVAGAVPSAGTWVSGTDLTERPEALERFVDAESARIQERHGLAPRRDVAASRALHDYLWSVSLLMSGAWYLERRVPRIRPAEIRLDLATGTFEVAPGSGFACLPDDPAADGRPQSGVGRSGVRVVGHEEALRAELRAAVVDHMRPLLTAIGPAARRGPRALWGMAADDLVSGIWYLGRVLGQEERAVGAATELLPTAIAPFPGGANFRRLAGREGRRYPTRTRLGCCLYYALDAARACGTCPRTCDAERLRRLEDEG